MSFTILETLILLTLAFFGGLDMIVWSVDAIRKPLDPVDKDLDSQKTLWETSNIRYEINIEIVESITIIKEILKGE